MSELISLHHIEKSFGAVKALQAVDLKVHAGEILGLVGENGAGKSTLMKILSGVYPAGSFEGEIHLQGSPVRFDSPKDSEGAGISLIHQELSTFPHLSVAENMAVGHWPLRSGVFKSLIDYPSMLRHSRNWLDQLAADFSAQDQMSSLSTGQQQVVEIAKALSRHSRILILDEPTSSLTQRETARLFALLKKLRTEGCALIYISHRMQEIFELTDRVVVLRDGKSVFTSETKNLKEEQLIQAMVGRKIETFTSTAKDADSTGTAKKLAGLASSGVEILKLDQFKALHRNSGRRYGPLTLSLKTGEVVGFSGLLGAGRSEIFQALCGDETFESSGTVLFKDSSQAFSRLRNAYSRGLGLVAEDRKHQSILPSRSLSENTGCVRLSQKSLWSRVSNTVEKYRSEKDLLILKTKFHSTNQRITELSGGNQQKVIFARVLQNSPDVLILDEPTRGVDVGAKFEIYQLIRHWASGGKAIILISSDLPELMTVSDRILVMAHGQIQGELTKSQFNEEAIMQLAVREATA